MSCSGGAMATLRRAVSVLLYLSLHPEGALGFSAAAVRPFTRTAVRRLNPAPLASASQATAAASTAPDGTGDASSLKEVQKNASSLYSPPELVAALHDASSNSAPLGVQGIFSVMARCPAFMKEMWETRPFYCHAPLPSLAGQYTLDDVQAAVDADFVEAGRGTFSEGSSGWRMAQVSQPRGKSFEDAKLRFEDVQRALKEKSGTVVVNSAGAYIRPLAGICLEVVQALDIPVCLNLYITAAGQKTSAPPHTDKQDVFVMQTQGRKRWRVFQPPTPSAKPNADPMARGKGSDVLTLSELMGEGKRGALLDVVLEPGQLLYVPAGFPHTTDTVTGITDGVSDPSVHLTIGVDTHIWGLNYATLRDFSLRRSGVADPRSTPLEKSVGESEYWRLFSALPVGFLGEETTAGWSRWSEMKQAQMTEMISTAAKIAREMQPDRWEDDASDEQVLGGSESGVVAQRLLDHHAKITSIFKEMYGDVRHGLTDVPRDSSFLRSRPYLDVLERTMSQFVQWGMAGSAPVVPQAAAGAAVASKGGFGGAGAGSGGKKGGGASKKKSKRK